MRYDFLTILALHLLLATSNALRLCHHPRATSTTRSTWASYPHVPMPCTTTFSPSLRYIYYRIYTYHHYHMLSKHYYHHYVPHAVQELLVQQVYELFRFPPTRLLFTTSSILISVRSSENGRIFSYLPSLVHPPRHTCTTPPFCGHEQRRFHPIHSGKSILLPRVLSLSFGAGRNSTLHFWNLGATDKGLGEGCGKVFHLSRHTLLFHSYIIT